MKKLIRITTVPISLEKLLGEQLRFMNQPFEVTGISADSENLQRVADGFGIKNFHVEMTRAITPLQDFKAIFKLYKFLKKEKPEIVHSHTPKAGLVGMIAAKLAGVPIRLHTVAGLPLMEATGMKRKVLNLVEKITYAFATKVYPNSKGLEDFILEQKFCSRNKLKIIGNGSSNGINTEFFNVNHFSESDKRELKSELNINDEDFVFIFVGRLVKDKGINELVEAFKNLKTLKPSNPQTPKLLLVGPLESELDPLLPKTLQEIETNENIISVGFKQDVRPYFAISDALAFPSYREGFPNVVMQAGTMELPSIVTDINGCNEIIEERENGLIIPAKNTSELQNAMQKIIEDQVLYNHLKQNARPMIESRYSQQTVWKALLEEYKMLLKM